MEENVRNISLVEVPPFKYIMKEEKVCSLMSANGITILMNDLFL